MKINLLLLLISCVINCYGQIKVDKVETGRLPKEIGFTGNLIKSMKWKDSLGSNYLVITETGEYKSTDKEGDNFKNAGLYAYHYLKTADSIKLTWKIYDYSKECPFDLFVKFIGDGFKVTDLDSNGIAEIWILYSNQCTSDVSPAPFKIIMYEGTKKYAMRGESVVKISEKELMGGKYTMDDHLKKANIKFKQYAMKLWDKFKIF